MRRTRNLVGIVAASSLALTAVVALDPSIGFGGRNPELHIAMQTVEVLIALLVAALLIGRFRRRRHLDDLLLCGAFGMLALSNLLFSAIPELFARDEGVFSTWASLLGRLLGAVLFAAAAVVPMRRLRLRRRHELRLAFGLLAALGLIAALVALFHGSLPSAVEAGPPAADSGRPDLDSHWAVLAAQIAGLALYAGAAAGFVRRSERTDDPLLRWLAVAAVLSAAARLHYFLYPSLFSDYVYTGDFFRLGFYLVVLGAAMSEVRSYWRGAAAAAALEERARIARDLHDGLAQELASVQRNLRWMDADDEFVRRATAAADRALDQARRAIHALALSERSHPIGDLLKETAVTVAERENTRVVVDTPEAVDVAPAVREALVMIASEAITNAARHGGADRVRVELVAGPPLRLRVSDSGHGFEPGGNGSARGVGLRVMRERAEGVGASFRVESKPGAGTVVEVLL